MVMANVFGTNAAETIDAADGVTNGADTIFGFGGNDTIFGLSGNDEILGGAGADSINGGFGTDTANYSDSAEGVFVSLLSHHGSGGTAEGDTLTSIENLTGSSHEDFLIGDDGNNVLTGLEDADTLKGGGGADTLYGDSGNDTLKGGGGGDTLNGGSGIDTADYFDSAAGVFISLITDTAAYGDAEGDELNSIENLNGSAYHDDLWGSDGVNVINGRDGNDSLKGFGGNDTLWGGDGNDLLYGMDGTDTLHGDDGSDLLDGGTGNDLMFGGLGNDTYVVDQGNGTGTTDQVMENVGEGYDTVRQEVSLYYLPANIESLRLEEGAVTGVGNTLDNTIVGNDVHNEIGGGDGNDVINGRGGADLIYTGSGHDVIAFNPGEANGDIVVDFEGNGAAAGDMLAFSGYGAGATFTQIDAVSWQINYNGGMDHDVITFFNGAAISPFDYTFV
jgi:Ca2+-binding RTX toxin-like protein